MPTSDRALAEGLPPVMTLEQLASQATGRHQLQKERTELIVPIVSPVTHERLSNFENSLALVKYLVLAEVHSDHLLKLARAGHSGRHSGAKAGVSL